MSMIVEHSKALNGTQHVMHEFLLRFSKVDKVVYGFFEGKDDPCFYKGFIHNAIPDNWRIESWSVGGKDNLQNLHDQFDWTIYPKTQIAFYLDKDLIKFTKEKVKQDVNIYVTDNYSIENSIVSKYTCERVLTEICGFGLSSHEYLDITVKSFSTQFELFRKNMISIMSYIIFWKLQGLKTPLNNIEMKHLFKFENGKLKLIKKPKGFNSQISYIKNRLKIKSNDHRGVREVRDIFQKETNYQNFIRGKYVLWFLVQFCISVRESFDIFFPDLNKCPKEILRLSQNSAIAVIGPRCKCPKSLNVFFKKTYKKYVKSFNNNHNL